MKQASISEPGWSYMTLGTSAHRDRATQGTKCDIPLVELNTLLLNVLCPFEKPLDETKVKKISEL